MSPTAGESLAEVLVAAARRLGVDEQRSDAAGTSDYLRDARAFATVDPNAGAASFLLPATIAAAALRTPDTSPSPRGSGWVTLRPALLDGHAIDRATAWFESAWRHAAG